MTTHIIPLPASSVATRIVRLARKTAVRVVELVQAYNNRRNAHLLAGLDDRMLKDIGLSRGDLRDAVAEPLWRDPTELLVKRVRERRDAQRPRIHGSGPQRVAAPPTAPAHDDTWSSGLLPARSPYY